MIYKLRKPPAMPEGFFMGSFLAGIWHKEENESREYKSKIPAWHYDEEVFWWNPHGITDW
ncbi:Hypothetical protein LUCI_0490 [Lucifera butyrica]|uniref:Uncharacterized protein n=1 Tax=Lucifera butyrica TaxID=1351585 RepID=A0A498R520_9FIRM|nr:Hypothetical protein LUCI_0490 [Lucifera butyrica]